MFSRWGLRRYLLSSFLANPNSRAAALEAEKDFIFLFNFIEKESEIKEPESLNSPEDSGIISAIVFMVAF